MKLLIKNVQILLMKFTIVERSFSTKYLYCHMKLICTNIFDTFLLQYSMLVNSWMEATLLVVGHHSQVPHEPVNISWTVVNADNCSGDSWCSTLLIAPQHRPRSNVASITR